MAISLLSTLVAGCAGPTPYEIRGQAAPMINRNSNGAPLSVVVKLYQLKSQEAFNKLSFDLASSGRNDNELFGSDLVAKSEFIVMPGRKYTGNDIVQPDTKYVGVIAYFRKPDAHYWRYLVDASTVRNKGLSFRVQECYLVLDGIKPTEIPGQPLNVTPSCNSSGSRTAFKRKHFQISSSALREGRATIQEARDTLEQTHQLKKLAIGTSQ
jgi:type VI secretion system protein VasD